MGRKFGERRKQCLPSITDAQSTFLGVAYIKRRDQVETKRSFSKSSMGVDEILGDFHPIQARACVGQDVHAHAVALPRFL